MTMTGMMKTRVAAVALLLTVAHLGVPGRAEAEEAAAGQSLTIYTGGFGVVRETVPLRLSPGVNRVSFSEATSLLEPDSVILRDPRGQVAFSILEQNYRNDPVSEELMLSLFEGRTIQFLVTRGEIEDIITGRIIRSGYQPGGGRRGPARASLPIIEVGGQVRFGLPGQPLFPSLADDTILKPTLYWLIDSPRAASLDAQLAYVTGGLGWEASYNAVSPETGDNIDLTGWVTINNNSGKVYSNASVKLIAGDVSRVQQPEMEMKMMRSVGAAADAAVEARSFDEYHMYTLARRTTIEDSSQKQIEFVRAEGVLARRLYVYEGAPRHFMWSGSSPQTSQGYGVQSPKDVWVIREIENKKDNGLGIALPNGRLRFYRRDIDGSLEFTGENRIEHTPRNETLRVYTGNAFDLVGERRQTNFSVDTNRRVMTESFEITLRNRKEEVVEIRAVERMFAGRRGK